MKKTLKKLSSKINGDKLFLVSNILFWSAIFLTFFVTGIQNLDPDFAWHLRVGEEISITRQEPSIEKYLFPTLGEHWVDHEWLSNLLLFNIYSFFGNFGYWSLGIIFALIALGTVSLVAKINRKYFVAELPRWDFFFLNTVFTTLATLALLRSYGIRLQVMTWLFFVLCFWLYFKIEKERKLKYLWAFPVLFCLWANLHGTFVLGLAISLLLLAFLFYKNKEKVLRVKITIAGFLTIFSTLLTPYGIELWKLIAGEYTQNTSYLVRIFEWLPLYAAPYIEWYATFYLSLIIFVFLISLILKTLPKKPSVLLYSIFVIFTLLISVKSRRFISMFALCSFPFAIFAISKMLDGKIIKKYFGIIVCIIALPIICNKLVYASTVPKNLLIQNTPMAPYKAVAFLKENKQLHPYNIYNKYGWGGYLVWMWPEKLHFIDGRMPQKPLTDGTSFIEEYHLFREDAILTKEKLTQYDIKIALLSQERSVADSLPSYQKFILKYLFSVDIKDFEGTDTLREYLEKNWKEIYADDFSVVYISPEIE